MTQLQGQNKIPKEITFELSCKKNQCNYQKQNGGWKTVQWEKVLATKLEDLISIPRTYIVEREPTALSCPVTSTCALWHAFICPSMHRHTHTH